jgi:hypothetical protein
MIGTRAHDSTQQAHDRALTFVVRGGADVLGHDHERRTCDEVVVPLVTDRHSSPAGVAPRTRAPSALSNSLSIHNKTINVAITIVTMLLFCGKQAREHSRQQQRKDSNGTNIHAADCIAEQLQSKPAAQQIHID